MDKQNYAKTLELYVKEFEELGKPDMHSFIIESAENATIYTTNIRYIYKHTKHPNEYLNHYEYKTLEKWFKESPYMLLEAQAFWGIYMDLRDALHKAYPEEK